MNGQTGAAGNDWEGNGRKRSLVRSVPITFLKHKGNLAWERRAMRVASCVRVRLRTWV